LFQIILIGHVPDKY